ncbi:tight adherence protein C [Salirhabdus euzebyi]|uniref:Tight adherence protein C n=1 Tax=Salirhabdus euzebyi TaxID=394506 RepID=A0A841Q4M1_9BACI|nr:type II secretion system F family protein [Salirhabdus euzebyi]MBB6453327.1 tight adherence protein C [Salirhabdus euzebyi]
MQLIFVLFTTFMFFMLITAGVLNFLYKRELIMEKRLALVNGGALEGAGKQRKGNSIGINDKMKPMIHKLHQSTEKKMSKAVKMDLEKKLREAGNPFGWTPIEFRVTQLLAGLFAFSFAFLLFIQASPDKFFSILFLSLTFAALGLYIPQFYLSVRKRKRVEQIQKDMPDFFDMVNLSIEAGLGVDSAVLKVCHQNKGPLSDEFMRALEDMKLGKLRKVAYSNVRDRVPLDSFQSVMTSLIQADQLGLGMGKVIRQLTHQIREKQRQLAREKAMKAPVKMIFPMLLFIFPAMFIVLLGPLVIQLIQGVLSM